MCYKCGKWIRETPNQIWLDDGERWLCDRCIEKIRHRYDRSAAYPKKLLEET